MELEKILELDGKLVREEILDEIEESEFVTEVEDCGMSGINPTWHYWNIKLNNGEEVRVYSK